MSEIHVTQVYRETSVAMSAVSGYFDVPYTHVLRDTHGRFNRETAKILIRASGMYLVFIAGDAAGVDMNAAYNLNGNYSVFADATFNAGMGGLVWMNEGDQIGGAFYRPGAGTLTTDRARAFTVAGPL